MECRVRRPVATAPSELFLADLPPVAVKVAVTGGRDGQVRNDDFNVNRWLRVTGLVAPLSGAAAIGWALASGAHLVAVSDGSANVSSEVTTHLAEAGADGSNLPEMPALPPGHERSTRAIAFAPCAENAALDCGTLTVPVDYREPFGDTVDIAIIRARATNPTKRIGAIIGNPGGPGGSGVDFVLFGVAVG